MRATIRFLLGKQARELTGADPTRTVLQYLREDEGLCGTKEGCAEGDCGACTVTIAERDSAGGIRHRALNSCIMFVPALDGKQLIAVEHLAGENGALHPVQQSMVDHHASQCGFCTPGFVMSLATMHMAGETPDRAGIVDALAGNLCRCTGYRPILDAASSILKAERLHHPTDELRAQLDALGTDDETLDCGGGGRRFIAPRSLAELTDVLAREPAALILGGGTDVGLWVTKQHRDLPLVVSTEHVPQLRRIEATDAHLTIGGAVTYADAMAALSAMHPAIGALVRRIGSRQIRERGTIGGNVANASPIGDYAASLAGDGRRAGPGERRRPAAPARGGILQRISLNGAGRGRGAGGNRDPASPERHAARRLQSVEAVSTRTSPPSAALSPCGCKAGGCARCASPMAAWRPSPAAPT